jgi:hypothetical protein
MTAALKDDREANLEHKMGLEINFDNGNNAQGCG